MQWGKCWWSKIWLFISSFNSYHPPPLSGSLLPSMKNASFIWGLGLACLELIESTLLKCVIKWWMDQNGDPRHSTACDWKCFSSMFTVVLGSHLASNFSSGAQVQGLISASCSSHSPRSFRPIPLALWSWILVLSSFIAGCTKWLPVISLLLPVCSDEWMVSFKLPSVTQVVYTIQPASWKQLVPFRFASFFFLFYPIKVTETIAQLWAAQCSFSRTHKCVYLSCYLLTSQLWYKC